LETFSWHMSQSNNDDSITERRYGGNRPWISLRAVFKILRGCALVLAVLAAPRAIKKYRAKQQWWVDHQAFVEFPQKENVQVVTSYRTLAASDARQAGTGQWSIHRSVCRSHALLDRQTLPCCNFSFCGQLIKITLVAA
jgi:hypothetical protein